MDYNNNHHSCIFSGLPGNVFQDEVDNNYYYYFKKLMLCEYHSSKNWAQKYYSVVFYYLSVLCPDPTNSYLPFCVPTLHVMIFAGKIRNYFSLVV